MFCHYMAMCIFDQKPINSGVITEYFYLQVIKDMSEWKLK